MADQNKRHGERPHGEQPGPGGERPGPHAEHSAVTPQDQVHFSVPRWLRQFGYASWLLIGIVIVLVGVSYILNTLNTIVVPTLFAALLGATFLPAVDMMERRGVPRWAAALLVTVLILLAGLALVAVVVYGLIDQAPTIYRQLESAALSIQDSLLRYDIHIDLVDTVTSWARNSGSVVAQGLIGDVLSGVSSLASLIFGIFIALNILVYLLVGGRRIGHWVSTVIKPVPQPVAYVIIANSVRFMRGYIWGSTIIGVFNGLVVGIGAVIIGVPLAATMGIVAWATNYIPIFGALIGGAFAVLIALGVGGVSKAVAMLIVVLIANGPLQNVVAQFALGSALHLHGLVVLFATTIGGIVAGAIGGVFAAPLTKIGIDAYQRLKTAGLFELDEEAPAEVAVVAKGGPPAVPPPALPETPPAP